MDELEQINRILKGFKEIINRVDSLSVQDKSILEHLNIIKRYADQMIDTGIMFREMLKKVGLEEIKNRFGDDRVRKDLKVLANTLGELNKRLVDWVAIIDKETKTLH